MAAKMGSAILNKTKGNFGSTKSALNNKLFHGPLSKRPSKSR